MSANVDSQESIPPQDTTTPTKPTKKTHSVIRRHGGIIVYTLFYCAIAVTGWVILCILTFRPIGASSYKMSGQPRYYKQQSVYNDSANYLRAAKALLVIAGVLSIPLASAVCAQASAVFVQKRGTGKQGPTLRQAVILADRSWTNPAIWTRLYYNDDRKRYSSPALLGAMALTLLGCIIAPLQAIFVSAKYTPVPYYESKITHLVDLTDMVGTLHSSNRDLPSRLRLALASNTAQSPQSRLWSQTNDDYSYPNPIVDSFYTTSNLQDSFWSSVPADFSTGLVQQFAPRISSSATMRSIAPEDFPKNCSELTNGLYIKTSANVEFYDYTVEICMPVDITQSPWKQQQKRQDFQEEVYFKGTFNVTGKGIFAGFVPKGVSASKIIMDTTAGYFELPNYMNKQQPGPLLQEAFKDVAGKESSEQYWSADEYRVKRVDLDYKDDYDDQDDSGAYKASVLATKNQAPGPLLSLMLALFGHGSVLETLGSAATKTDVRSPISMCMYPMPFLGLISARDSQHYNTKDSPQLPSYDPWTCAEDNWDLTSTDYKAVLLGAFFQPARQVKDALVAAAFLTFDAMAMTHPSLPVSRNMGRFITVPSMSKGTMIAISILLGIDVLVLLALAVYCTFMPRWSTELDAFAMLRMGAALTESKMPLRITNNPDHVDELDTAPGWVGEAPAGGQDDGVDDKERIRDLQLGSSIGVKRGLKYRRYDTSERSRQRYEVHYVQPERSRVNESK